MKEIILDDNKGFLKLVIDYYEKNNSLKIVGLFDSKEHQITTDTESETGLKYGSYVDVTKPEITSILLQSNSGYFLPTIDTTEENNRYHVFVFNREKLMEYDLPGLEKFDMAYEKKEIQKSIKESLYKTMVEEISLFGQVALMTTNIINEKALPENLNVYDIYESLNNEKPVLGRFGSNIGKWISSVITSEDLLKSKDIKEIHEKDIDFIGKEIITLQDYIKSNALNLDKTMRGRVI